MKPPHPQSISATHLSELGLCQQMVALRLRHGAAPPTAERRARLEHGIAMHAQTEQAAAGRGKGSCFVATAVFGSVDPRTQALRLWRDRYLRRSRLGRAFIAAYYRVSPPIARQLAAHPRLAWPVRVLLAFVVDRLLPAACRREGVSS